MKTAQFTAIYFDYAMADVKAYIATFGTALELHGISVVRNDPNADGFFDWTATVLYCDAVIEYPVYPAAPVTPSVDELVAAVDFTADVLAFVAKLQAREDAGKNAFPATFTVDFNRAYIRICRSTSPLQRSAFGFIDYSGNLMKAASWKTPAKNFFRGNIYDASPMRCVSLYSVQ